MHLYSDNKVQKKRQAERLWESLRLGQRNALDELFRLYYDSLLVYGVRLINEQEIVKDGIQELFLRLWQHHESLSQAQSPEAYLLCSLRRILLRYLSNRKKRIEHNKGFLDEVFLMSFSEEDVIIRRELKMEQKKELLRAINHLNDRQKETLFLRYYHGLTNAEIAQVMSISHQSVKNHLSRAIKSLQAIVQSFTVYDKKI